LSLPMVEGLYMICLYVWLSEGFVRVFVNKEEIP